MDTSKNYIRMCQQAEEIQTQWKPSEGDWCLYKAFVPKPYIGVLSDLSLEVVLIYKEEARLNDYTWLPRQDQLQEMIFSHKECTLPSAMIKDPIKGICRFIDKSCIGRFDSMEQLWLAFVMNENYRKIWNGYKWENING